MTTALRLLVCGDEVIGLDNLNDYDAVNLELARLRRLEALPGLEFRKAE